MEIHSISSDYSDIIDTQWPQPQLKGRMLLKDRAKIFLPFAALKGYDEVLDETENSVTELFLSLR